MYVAVLSRLASLKERKGNLSFITGRSSQQPRFGADCYIDNSRSGPGKIPAGEAVVYLPHIVAPDRAGKGRAGKFNAQGVTGFVKTKPDRRGVVGTVANRPCVRLVLGSPGLARHRHPEGSSVPILKGEL